MTDPYRMATKAQVLWNRPSRRRDPRRVSALPVDITVVRANASDRLPGRCLNVSARGIAAALAGELRAGEVVGVELTLPSLKQRWRADAVVRHGRQLDHGFEFSGLPDPQQKMLVEWLRAGEAEQGPTAQLDDSQPGLEDALPAREPSGWRWLRRACMVLLLAVAFAAGVMWRWEYGWRHVEPAKPSPPAARIVPDVRIPAEEMAKRLVYRADPDYPDAARAQNLAGVVVLDIVVGRDGSVVEVSPQYGPQVLTRAAAEAVRWWKFEPVEINGAPAVVGTTVEVEFRAPVEATQP